MCLLGVCACPRVARFLMEQVPGLSRLHFHSLPFHIVAQRIVAQRGALWGPATSSVASGSVAATLKACDVAGEAALHGNDLDIKAPLTVAVQDPLVGGATPAQSVSNKAPVVGWAWSAAGGGR